jgi:hypothetical protein
VSLPSVRLGLGCRVSGWDSEPLLSAGAPGRHRDSVLLNVRISSTNVHLILIQFKKHFKLVDILGSERGRHAGLNSARGSGVTARRDLARITGIRTWRQCDVISQISLPRLLNHAANTATVTQL